MFPAVVTWLVYLSPFIFSQEPRFADLTFSFEDEVDEPWFLTQEDDF